MMTIIDLLKSDGIEARHVSKNEYHSPCPECGGKDRFLCWPEKPNRNGQYMGGRFYCRRCEFSGDAVTYVMKVHGKKFMEACKELDIDLPERKPTPHTARHDWQPSPPKPEPCREWQEQANGFLLSCIQCLQRNPEVREWLHAERGLTDETIRRFKLGWNPKDQWADRQAWGLPEAIREDGKPKKQWLPKGLVVPFFPGGKMIRLRIRRDDPKDGSRYIVAAGSNMAPMVIGRTKHVIVVVESELDGVLIAQEAGDLIDVVAVGSAQARPDRALHERLTNASLVLCALDADGAGASAAWKFWTRYPGFKRWPCVRGKDQTEMMQAGVPVRAWIKEGIK